MAYLARWRMTLARRLLREGMTVAEVAERRGYDSEAGFAKAFKRVTGVGPGAARSRDR
jgi:AraC-like DNA-binding protein